MANDRQNAMAEFRRIIVIIAVIAVLMVAGALTYLYLTSTLDTNTVVATTLGVFFSVLLGCGLFAAAFFSDKSGHDDRVNDASKSERERRLRPLSTHSCPYIVAGYRASVLWVRL